MLHLSHPSNHWMVNCSQAMQTSPKKRVLISAPGASRVIAFPGPYSTCGSSTQTLRLQLRRRLRASTPNTNPARDASTSRESVRWRVQALCHWFSRPLEEWGLLAQLPSSVSPACSAESSTVSLCRHVELAEMQNVIRAFKVHHHGAARLSTSLTNSTCPTSARLG